MTTWETATPDNIDELWPQTPVGVPAAIRAWFESLPTSRTIWTESRNHEGRLVGRAAIVIAGEVDLAALVERCRPIEGSQG